MTLLLSRDDFREGVFRRDNHRCVICYAYAQDAHHIIERRLFPDGGYYLNNGASLCGPCHLRAESTEISCERIRSAACVGGVVLPPHFYPDQTYDKWGNAVLPNGRRIRGELFEDISVQKVIRPVLHLFDNHVKYPRTWHLPWSASVNPDDRVLDGSDVDSWEGTDVVVSIKMDGENTSLYHDYLHARSLDYASHISRDLIKNLHAMIAHDIPSGMRICGENLSYKHSIYYNDLTAYFQVFSIWEGVRCLSWKDTVEWAQLLGLDTVRVVGQKPFHRPDWEKNYHIDPQYVEGYVIRPSGEFTLNQFPHMVGKYVRKQHVQTHGHWQRSRLTRNHTIADNPLGACLDPECTRTHCFHTLRK